MSEQQQLQSDMEEIRKGGLLERCRELKAENARLRNALKSIRHGNYACADKDCKASELAHVALTPESTAPTQKEGER